MKYLHYHKVFMYLNITNVGRNIESSTIWLLCVMYGNGIKLNIFCCVFTTVIRHIMVRTILFHHFLNANYFNVKHVFNLFSFSREQNSLSVSSPKWEPHCLWAFHVWRYQEEDPCTTRGREPSAAEVGKADRRAEDGKVESLVLLSQVSVCSSHTLGCGSIDLGTPLAEGAVKMVIPHTYTDSLQLI